MDNFSRKALENWLARESYQTIDKVLGSRSSEQLLDILDNRSHKIGDTAAGLLQRRKETALLLDALLNDRIRTARGKVRATNILNAFGRAVPDAIDGYIHVLGDRSDDVVSNALFGIVFMRRNDLIPMLKGYLEAAAMESTRHELFREAIDALEANNPSIFSPGFADTEDVWHLNDQT